MKKTIFLVVIFIFLIIFFNIYSRNKAQNESADNYFYEANDILKDYQNDSLTINNTIELYSKAISLNSNHWAALRNRARGYIYFKKYDSAISDLNKAMKIVSYKEHPEILSERGYCFYEKKEYQNAINDFNICLTLLANKSDILMNIAKAYWELGDKENACINYKKALKQNSDIKPQNSFLRCG
jgi:tetratricopeptide (TPR) repeat protein